jgi:hypothetical protein
MYVPPFDSLLKAIGTTRAEFEKSPQVIIPSGLFKLLLQIAIASSEFNETGYLRDNPDIAQAMRAGTLSDPQMHYAGFGFLVRLWPFIRRSQRRGLGGGADGSSLTDLCQEKPPCCMCLPASPRFL